MSALRRSAHETWTIYKMCQIVELKSDKLCPDLGFKFNDLVPKKGKAEYKEWKGEKEGRGELGREIVASQIHTCNECLPPEFFPHNERELR